MGVIAFTGITPHEPGKTLTREQNRAMAEPVMAVAGNR